MPLQLPPPHLISETHYFLSGDVELAEGVGVAAGVLLQANPGCCIKIAVGACIGMGSILHADAGDLIVEAGATLGTGVLIIGSGTIGPNACIGSASTLLNPSIAADQVISPGSIVGDASRAVAEEQSPTPAEPTPVAPPAVPLSPVATVEQETQPAAEPPSPSASSPTPIPGQAHLHRLLLKIYPHRQALNGSAPDG
jgi:carbon dioxide concentrating mechanism protein CcmN